MLKNPELELALNFVEKTDRNIFLTGKAGTGKTTFLHKIKSESLKRLVVVAPTGVAAINAKGVTIHSFFQMPFGPIVPGVEQNKSGFKHKFSKTKIDIIRSLDLLIIDEISMVRADLLDGIDQVLRRHKDRDKVFGGVQVLMIGDLQQLSPVVKPYEWKLLKKHYDNAFFFSSNSFKECDAISIELKHIYRQEDEKFIAILNEVRNDTLTPKSAEVLNKRYQPNFVPPKDAGYITLTTHNDRANAINEQELNTLKSNSYFYKAQIEGKFNEYAYPTYENLELKEDSQVMFIKNDSSLDKRYYNGKIGKITFLDKDSITVQCPDDEHEIEVTPEVWENISYSIDEETKEIKEKTSGSFSQIPLRLAWAITIHKSQGLTFEKAIIDAEASFAHGQTYVALSRCKSLEGIVLKTQIRDSSIISDIKVDSFTKEVENNQPNHSILDTSQKKYQLNLINDLFNYYEFIYPLKRIIDIYYKNKTSLEGNIIDVATDIKDDVTSLLKISTTFKNQLDQLSTSVSNVEEDEKLQERLHKAITYFIDFTNEKIKQPFEIVSFTTDNKQVKKDLNKQLDQLENLISTKTYCLNGLTENFSVVNYLELRAKSVLQKSEKPSQSLKKKRTEITSTNHPKLFEELRELRHTIAHSENVNHYQIFTQKSLYEMCEYLPTTPSQLRTINGMGKVRVKKYGEEVLEIILKYVDENDIETNSSENLTQSETFNAKKPKKGETQQKSYELFKSGLTIQEIAKERGFVTGTIEGHLSQYILSGDIKVEDIMPKEKYLELKKIMKTTDFEGFTDLKNKVDDKFTYGEMRMVGMGIEFDKDKK
ncbi:MAG: helix-turn-helix domain-containing protein [Flavobacteriaceae bacterium]|nr:helix-turn-helix domain-containing protein [Flavobacteriaceae bacterium]